MKRNRFNMAHALGLSLFLLSLVSCAPSFNWREVRVEGEELTYLLPCKPGVLQKEVDWGEGAQALSMQGCEVQGVQFTLSWLALSPTTDALQMERLWQRASWASLNGSKQADENASLSSRPAASGVKLASTLGLPAYFEGKNAGGLQVHWVWFTKGDKLYQAGVYQTSAESAKTSQNTSLAQTQREVLETYLESFH
jgi:hypothetical protein